MQQLDCRDVSTKSDGALGASEQLLLSSMLKTDGGYLGVFGSFWASWRAISRSSFPPQIHLLQNLVRHRCVREKERWVLD